MANQPTLSDTPTVTIEAATVEEALGRLTEEVGPGARILRADRVRRGGIAGFFAREMVEIEAEAPGGEGVDGAFDRMLEAAESADERPVLNDSLTRPTLDSGPPPALTSQARPVTTTAWDSARMLELGLPGALVQAVASLDPSDDLGHLTALVEVLTPVCGSLPAEPMRLVGERAERLRSAIAIDESDTGLIHLVVGDELPATLPGVPAVVSWVSDGGVARAISLALGTGALLGYGIGSSFGAPVRRIAPLDAAIAIRELMDRT